MIDYTEIAVPGVWSTGAEYVRYDELVKLLQRWKISVVPKESMRVRGHDVDTFRQLAKQTETIDYDCDFTKGYCDSPRAMGRDGCCVAPKCAATLGYWRKEGNTLDSDTAQKLAIYYDPQKGFLREGAGCVLPRELRSPICLYLHCSDAKMSDDDKILLARIRYGAHMSSQN